MKHIAIIQGNIKLFIRTVNMMKMTVTLLSTLIVAVMKS